MTLWTRQLWPSCGLDRADLYAYLLTNQTNNGSSNSAEADIIKRDLAMAIEKGLYAAPVGLEDDLEGMEEMDVS